MTLDELGFDDDEIVDSNGLQEQEGEEDSPKPWMDFNNPEEQNPDDNNPDEEPTEDDELLTRILKSKGINPDAVRIQNDDGEVEEVSFYDLSADEQLDLVNYSGVSEQDYDLEDDEIGFLNHLRDNNLSVNDYLEYYRRQVIEEYQNGLQDNQNYDIDSFSDDELFIADLKDKIPDLTDEEAAQQLELEKQNETLFAKKMAGIRTQLKERERAVMEQAEQEAQAEEQQRAAAYEDMIVKTIQENDSIAFGPNESITLSEDDMNEIASFILDSDAAGVRYIAKALNDPKKLVQMAWYAMKGEEALSKIADYYKKKITEAGKTNYEKGFNDAKAGRPAAKSAVRRPQNQRNQKTIKSIDDLD